jgi:hypothetical protein
MTIQARRNCPDLPAAPDTGGDKPLLPAGVLIVQVSFTLETNGYQHTQEILTSLAENGFHLITPWAWKETALEIPYRLIFHRVTP